MISVRLVRVRCTPRSEPLFRPLPPAALFLLPGSEQLFHHLLRLALQNIDRGASDKKRKEIPDMIHQRIEEMAKAKEMEHF
jgi:hypothetical protein